MSWTLRVSFLSLLATVLILALCSETDSAAVPDDAEAAEPKGSVRHVFVPESDASNFFKQRGRRSAKRQAEVQAEQRVWLAARERRREHNEEQRDEFENYAEEEHDEQDERTRERSEQYREYHYDGLYPRYHWH